MCNYWGCGALPEFGEPLVCEEDKYSPYLLVLESIPCLLSPVKWCPKLVALCLPVER